MKRNRFFIVLTVFLYMTTYSIFEHDRAAHAVQKKDWQSACEFMTKAVAQDYQNPDVLFDAGVVAFNTGQYQQAQAYFSTIAQHETSPCYHKALQERAWYNSGNTYVKQEMLEQAVTSYEKALELDGQDKRARHNLEVVRRMLEQKKQQEKQDQDKKDNDKKDSKKDKQKQDNKGSNSDDRDDQKGDNKQDQQGDGQQSGNANNQEQGQDKDGQRGNKQNNKKQKGQNSPQDNGSQDQAGNDGDKQQGAQNKKEDRHNANKQQASNGTHGLGNQELKTAGNDDKNQGDGRDGVIARILQDQEARDLQLNKNMVKTAVGKKLAGQDGQNCW